MRLIRSGRCRAALYAGTTATSFMARLASPHGQRDSLATRARIACQIVGHDGRQHLGEGQARSPVEEPARLGQGRDAHQGIVVAWTVELGGALGAQAGQGRVGSLGAEGRQHCPRQSTDADVVAVVAEVHDLPLATLGPLDDTQKRVHELVDGEERAPLAAAVDQHQILPGEQRVHERGQHARDALAVDPGDEVHARADDVEGPDHGELEPAMLAVGPDHALKELLGGGVGPAFAMDGAEEERGPFLVHASRRAAAGGERTPAVDFAGGKVNEPALALRAQLDQGHEVGVAGVDHIERARVVEGGIAQGGERDDDVGPRGDFVEQPRVGDGSLNAVDPGQPESRACRS